MASYMDELAPGSGQTWRDVCTSEPIVGDDGILQGPWGDAIRAAVQYEQQNPGWEDRFPDGVVGSVISCMGECGYNDQIEAAGRTEEQFKSGGGPQVIGNAIAPGQVVMDASCMSAGLQCLAQHEKIEVKEEIRWIEALSAIIGQEIEMANKYKIFADGGQHELFYAVEQTDCCTRQLKQCAPDCAPWNLHIMYTENGQNQMAFKIDRPCTFTCCCLNRPKATITDAASGQTIGFMSDPFACCDLTFNLNDVNDEPVLKANGGCCQWGLCCPLPCGPCAEVNFPVSDAKTGDEVGHIQKKVPGCCKFLIAPDVDNYKIEFGKVQNPQYKALLLTLSIFIDFRYFNENPNDDEGGIAGQVAGGD